MADVKASLCIFWNILMILPANKELLIDDLIQLALIDRNINLPTSVRHKRTLSNQLKRGEEQSTIFNKNSDMENIIQYFKEAIGDMVVKLNNRKERFHTRVYGRDFVIMKKFLGIRHDKELEESKRSDIT